MPVMIAEFIFQMKKSCFAWQLFFSCEKFLNF